MYLILCTDAVTMITKCLYAHNLLLDAKSSYLKVISDECSKAGYEALFINNQEARIYFRNVGWMSSSKDIILVVQMLEFDSKIDEPESGLDD